MQAYDRTFVVLGLSLGLGMTCLAQSVRERVSGRVFPSVFQAWNRADNLPGED